VDRFQGVGSRYEARVLRPACNGVEPVAVDELAREYSLRDTEVFSKLNTVKRKIRNTLESIVLDTLETPDELDSELAELRCALAVPIGS
jgi:hypothetical protein